MHNLSFEHMVLISEFLHPACRPLNKQTQSCSEESLCFPGMFGQFCDNNISISALCSCPRKQAELFSITVVQSERHIVHIWVDRWGQIWSMGVSDSGLQSCDTENRLLDLKPNLV